MRRLFLDPRVCDTLCWRYTELDGDVSNLLHPLPMQNSETESSMIRQSRPIEILACQSKFAAEVRLGIETARFAPK
jgi:hypothetical protein